MGGRFSLRELALLWLVHQEGVSSIIAGARTEKQITANARLMERSLSESEWQSLDEYLKQQPLIKER
jgi:aryl-alcohol dehydrogenase-like predicted oxidoreductase